MIFKVLFILLSLVASQPPSRDTPMWKISLVDHPDVADEFGTLEVKGSLEDVRAFFEGKVVQVRPDCTRDSRTIDSFFDVFTEQAARDIDIRLECSCCPLKCKLTIKISF